MYITKIAKPGYDENFNWKKYFSSNSSNEILEVMDFSNMIKNLRTHLQEDLSRMTFILGKVMLQLLEDFDFKEPGIIELGAGTGFLTKWLISQYGGTGLLVDKNETSYHAFSSKGDHLNQSITYLIKDVFTLELKEKFDIVCSFGLIEHFQDKTKIINVHKKFVLDSGIIILVVPLDSPLSRAFFEVHPELNLGYRELLTRQELIDLLLQAELEVMKTQISNGYSYDFIGSLCRKK